MTHLTITLTTVGSCSHNKRGNHRPALTIATVPQGSLATTLFTLATPVRSVADDEGHLEILNQRRANGCQYSGCTGLQLLDEPHVELQKCLGATAPPLGCRDVFQTYIYWMGEFKYC